MHGRPFWQTHYESFVGGLYLDQGYEPCKEIHFGFIDPAPRRYHQEEIMERCQEPVQEEAQERVGMTPSYHVVGESGPDHDKYFTVAIYFGDQKIAEGKGKSKQEAQQTAALAAIGKERLAVNIYFHGFVI